MSYFKLGKISIIKLEIVILKQGKEAFQFHNFLTWERQKLTTQDYQYN